MVIKSIDPSSSRINIYLSHPWNLFHTGFLLLTWIIFGFYFELVGPTMPILAENTKTHYNGMGSVLASRAAGYLVGNIIVIFLQNIVTRHSEGLLVWAFILPAIEIFATPFVSSLLLMCALFFIEGVAQSLTNLAGTNLILTMWGINAAAPLNAVQSGYGIGAVLVNLLVRPFLIQKVLSTNTTDNEGIHSTASSVNTTWADSNIVIPYSIAAVLCVLIAVGHTYFYVRKLRNQKQKLEIRQVDYGTLSTDSENVSLLVEKETFSPYSPRTFGYGDFQYGLILSLILIFYVFFISGNDQSFSQFFFVYLKFENFHLSTGEASWGVILYWTFFSIGRIIGAIASIYVSVSMCLNIIWFGGFCLSITWLIFVWVIGLTSTSLLILGAGTGLVFGPMYPISLGFINQRLNVTPILLAAVLCGSAAGAALFQQIAGFIMDLNSKYFPILLFICMSISIILYIVSNVFYLFHERKKLLNPRPSLTNGAALYNGSFNGEEHQTANDLSDEEDK